MTAEELFVAVPTSVSNRKHEERPRAEWSDREDAYISWFSCLVSDSRKGLGARGICRHGPRAYRAQ